MTMTSKVIAIINSDRLKVVEDALLTIKIQGISISQVQGYGEYHNLYQRDMMCQHARIEIFCPQDEAHAIAECIINASHTGLPGDGIVAIQPVEHLYHIRNQS